MADSYIDLHRARMLQNGKTPKERIETAGAKDFERSILPNSPNRAIITYEDKEYACVLASGNSRVGTQTERKVTQYLETSRTLRLPEGALFTTIDLDMNEKLYWLVLHREIHPYYAYFKYKVVELNHKVKYVDRNGVVKEIPVYINGTGEFDIKEYFKLAVPTIVQVPNRALNFIMAANEDFKSDNLKRELRFIIGEEAWHYVDSDKVSIPGVYFATVMKDPRDETNDSIPEQLADIDHVGQDKIISTFGASLAFTIGKDFTDLQFYYMSKGRIKEADIVYSDYDDTIIKVENNKIIPIAAGPTSFTATDKISGINKTVEITVEDTMSDYLTVVGNTALIVEETKPYQVLTNMDYRVVFDATYLKVKQDGNILSVTAKMKTGNTSLDFYDGDTLIEAYPIEINSLWV